MGSALYVVLKEALPEAERLIGDMEGKALGRAVEQLDEIAADLGLAPLMSFFCADPEELSRLMNEGEDDEDEEDEDDDGEEDYARVSAAGGGDDDEERWEDPLDDEAGGEEDEDGDDGSGSFVEQWFGAAEGLDTVRGLIEELETDPEVVDEGEAVLADLVALERVLAVAEGAEVPFHLTIDF